MNLKQLKKMRIEFYELCKIMIDKEYQGSFVEKESNLRERMKNYDYGQKEKRVIRL